LLSVSVMTNSATPGGILHYNMKQNTYRATSQHPAGTLLGVADSSKSTDCAYTTKHFEEVRS
jgi:hypothetical protein